ncbi:MAG: hypothetical protein HOP19_08530 [Acidobacteria bacterium]|nr:hypothetical protein [Acidobacteriota bacterium]
MTALLDGATVKPTNHNTQSTPSVVCISSHFLTDRLILHSSFLPTLAAGCRPLVTSEAITEPAFPQDHPQRDAFHPVPLPQGSPGALRQARHLATHTWDHKGLSASRASMWRHRSGPAAKPRDLLMRGLSKPLAALGLENWLERKVERALVRYGAQAEIRDWLQAERAALVVIMNPFLDPYQQVAAAARSLGLPIVAFITSWDNISTKSRMVFDYDAYLVWSDAMKAELHQFYPRSVKRPVFVTGSPIYDAFCQPRFEQSRESFCQMYGLNPKRPILLYSLGSPRFIREDYGLRPFLTAQAQTPELQNAQVIIRLHPGHGEAKVTELENIRRDFPHAVIQSPQKHWQRVPFQSEEGIREWISSVRHADVLINLSSTMAVDAAYFDHPVVNINFDPEPGGPNQTMIKEINQSWNHFRPICESGGLWLASDMNEVIQATVAYLRDPSLHRAGRRKMVQHVCGPVDGQAGRRMAEACLSLLTTVKT